MAIRTRGDLTLADLAKNPYDQQLIGWKPDPRDSFIDLAARASDQSSSIQTVVAAMDVLVNRATDQHAFTRADEAEAFEAAMRTALEFAGLDESGAASVVGRVASRLGRVSSGELFGVVDSILNEAIETLRAISDSMTFLAKSG